MIYVFVELTGYKQLMHLRPRVVEGTVENLKGLVEYSGGRCEFCETGTLLFSIDPLEKGERTSIELIHHVYGVLLERRRELQGFVVVAEQHASSIVGTTFSVLGQLRRSALSADRSDSLWLGRKLWDFLGEGFVGEDAGDLVRVVERMVDGPRSTNELQEFFVRPHLVEKIGNAVKARAEGGGSGDWIRICASETSGIDAGIRRALDTFTGERQFNDWCYLGAGRDSLTLLEPFLEGMRRDFLTAIPEFLSKSDRNLWEKDIGILDFPCPDHAVEDFFSIYSLYLLAYSRFMKRHDLPPVLVCPNADRYPQGTLRFLSRLLDRFRDFGKLIPICITSDEAPLGALESITHETILVGGLSPRETSERVRRFSQLAEADGKRLGDAARGEALFLYHACLIGKSVKCKGVRISLELLKRGDDAGRRILYTSYLTDGLLNQAQISQLLAGLGLPDEVYKRELADLIRLGFMDERSGRLAVDEIGHLLTGEKDLDGLRGRIADFCYSLWQSGDLSITVPPPANPERISALFWFLSMNGRFDQALPVFVDLIGRMLDQGRVEDALHYLEQENQFRMNLTSEETRRRDFFIELMAFRAAILLESKEQADLRLVRLKEMQIGGEWEKSLLYLVSAQHHYAAFESRSALDAAKRSLISAQAVESESQECKADIEIGLAMLATTRLEEAEDYFSLARTAVPEDAAVFEHIRSLFFEAVTLYLFGNLSKALRTAKEAGDKAAVAGRREWQRLALFLRGRCYFTLGMYDAALKVFQAGVSFCRVYPDDEATKVFVAWAGRAVTYGENGDPFEYFDGLTRDAEVLFFLSEYAEKSGDLGTAVELINESLDVLRGNLHDYLPSETVPWFSGFAAIEDRSLRSFDGKGVLYSNAKAMRAYLRGMEGNVDEAITEFTRLAREDRLSEHDPNNYSYYYLHSRIVPHGEGELLVDRLTVLSKALKHVQERATRIDEVKKRQSFLRCNRWNSRLIEDAKSMKLM